MCKCWLSGKEDRMNKKILEKLWKPCDGVMLGHFLHENC